MSRETDLIQGRIVAIPTDTVYGLAATFDYVHDLSALKGRSHEQPILVLAATLFQIEPYLKDPTPSFYTLAEEHWPGALTLIVPVGEGLPAGVQKGGMCGFRIPSHPLALELLAKTGPLAVTSANRSGEPPATTAEQVRAIFGDAISVLDGGEAQGLPSTILRWNGQSWECLRQGQVVLD